ncbi:craniofacial development protein 1 isoform X1 [Schistocerca cancellata]|uniref:craniofacial development protein 1 isoform X1 n=1 Tax=Schistocerca cancellata TaxID=274614 RepID=UPI0021186FE3|nr:craniofacial development protein 1 isoform X1 [Schistocerca cancellata]XP_049778344.1 craniofacial development protein 1 isoform X1 [Schistocerca cancellata]
MDQRELPSDSDESDEDYVPSGAESNPPSEEESDENEAANEDASEEEPEEKGKRKRSSKKLKTKTAKRFRRKKLAPENDEKEEVKETLEERNVLTEEEEKKKADSLWSDFLKDTGSVSKNKNDASLPNGKSDREATVMKQEENRERENKVTITKVYEFAGEEVKVTKEVPVDSVEAKTAATKPHSTSLSPAPAAGRGQGKARGGLSSVLGMIGNKKQKLGTLEKSKLDWDRFKKAEGIEEELQTHNRGRDGYLDKLDFLQRTDIRQFELEKQLRTSRRSNR